MDRMQTLVVVGLQWGDEGKGKLVDFLSEHFDIVVRFQGGSNAGHTVKVGDDVFRFRIMPTGAVRRKKAVIGNGVVVDPVVLLEEVEQMRRSGVNVDLLISDRAHVITPYNVEIDTLQEGQKGSMKVGTTKRGIGPTYAGKASRTGVRVCDLLGKRPKDQWHEHEAYASKLLEGVYGSPVSEDVRVSVNHYLTALRRLEQYVGDSSTFLCEEIEKGSSVLFEGAQGTLLDIDHGTYPFVTSSNCTASAAANGTGVPHTSLGSVLGIAKAYQTRVGTGPFPTELNDETGEVIRDRGHEYGTVTGRPRRCGWLDLVALRYAVRLNGSKHLAITKADVLTGIHPLKVCTAYEIDGHLTHTVPALSSEYERAVPVYEECDGWESITPGLRRLGDAPIELGGYLERIESFTGARVVLLSVGPDRVETVVAEGVFPWLP